MSQRVKAVLKQVLPPIVVEAAKLMRGRPAERETGAPREDGAPLPPPDWEAVPDSEAIWTAQEGWAHQSIAQTQQQKWPAFLAAIDGAAPFGTSHEAPAGAPPDLGAHNTIITFGYVLGRVAGTRRRISILDWGGGIGHYYEYARRLRPDLEFDYVIKDMAPICEVGRKLLPDVVFRSDEAQALARSYDLVFASSSLQYSRDLYGVLARLCDAAAPWLVVTRSPFVDRHDDFVVVQRPHRYGYLTEYVAWFINRPRFLAAVEARGLRLEREFMVGEQPDVPNAPEQCRYRGFLFRRERERPLAPG
jgi:putative methyltransferase (TIGR04325 family)